MKTVLALAFCLIASCASVQQAPQNKLVGEWLYQDKIQTCRYAFNGDGSFHGEVTYHGKLISKFAGRWSLQGNTVFYRYTADTLGRISVGTIDRDKLLEVQATFFTIEAADGSRRKYIRLVGSVTRNG